MGTTFHHERIVGEGTWIGWMAVRAKNVTVDNKYLPKSYSELSVWRKNAANGIDNNKKQ